MAYLACFLTKVQGKPRPFGFNANRHQRHHRISRQLIPSSSGPISSVGEFATFVLVPFLTDFPDEIPLDIVKYILPQNLSSCEFPDNILFKIPACPHCGNVVFGLVMQYNPRLLWSTSLRKFPGTDLPPASARSSFSLACKLAHHTCARFARLISPFLKLSLNDSVSLQG